MSERFNPADHEAYKKVEDLPVLERADFKNDAGGFQTREAVQTSEHAKALGLIFTKLSKGRAVSNERTENEFSMDLLHEQAWEHQRKRDEALAELQHYLGIREANLGAGKTRDQQQLDAAILELHAKPDWAALADDPDVIADILQKAQDTRSLSIGRIALERVGKEALRDEKVREGIITIMNQRGEWDLDNISAAILEDKELQIELAKNKLFARLLRDHEKYKATPSEETPSYPIGKKLILEIIDRYLDERQKYEVATQAAKSGGPKPDSGPGLDALHALREASGSKLWETYVNDPEVMLKLLNSPSYTLKDIAIETHGEELMDNTEFVAALVKENRKFLHSAGPKVKREVSDMLRANNFTQTDIDHLVDGKPLTIELDWDAARTRAEKTSAEKKKEEPKFKAGDRVTIQGSPKTSIWTVTGRTATTGDLVLEKQDKLGTLTTFSAADKLTLAEETTAKIPKQETKASVGFEKGELIIYKDGSEPGEWVFEGVFTEPGEHNGWLIIKREDIRTRPKRVVKPENVKKRSKE